MNIIILTTTLAPYRVDYFNELGKYCNLTVFFEKMIERGRDDIWYKKDFQFFKAVFLKKWDKPQWRIRTDIIKHMQNTKYDIAIAFEYSTPTALLFMLCNIINKKPFCINGDGGFVSDNIIKSIIKRFFIKKAAACFASGIMTAKYFSHYGALKDRIHFHNFTSLMQSEILNFPVPVLEKQLLRTELQIPHKMTAISVGQFIHRKGFDTLIKGWSKVSSEYQLLIIGAGEQKEEYIKLIEDLNLKNIQIIGFKEKKELAKYFKASDLFVLSTREDIWGLVVNEAMAFGLPVITTDRCIAGLELVHDYENGFIIPVEDADALARRIEEVLSDSELSDRMARKSIERIKPYTIENMAQKHLQLCTELVYCQL